MAHAPYAMSDSTMHAILTPSFLPGVLILSLFAMLSPASIPHLFGYTALVSMPWSFVANVMCLS